MKVAIDTIRCTHMKYIIKIYEITQSDSERKLPGGEGECMNNCIVSRMHDVYNNIKEHALAHEIWKYVGVLYHSKNLEDPYASTQDTQMPVSKAVSYTHLRAHETPEHLVCRLLLEKKKKKKKTDKKLYQN